MHATPTPLSIRGSPMTLHQFTIFSAIAKRKNLTRASEALHISQLGVSQQMRLFAGTPSSLTSVLASLLCQCKKSRPSTGLVLTTHGPDVSVPIQEAIRNRCHHPSTQVTLHHGEPAVFNLCAGIFVFRSLRLMLRLVCTDFTFKLKLSAGWCAQEYRSVGV